MKCRFRVGLISLIFMSLAFPVHAESGLEELKMKKRVGLGVAAAGPFAVLGVELDINVTEELSIGGGLGTGLDYSTFVIKGRYFLLGERFSPYLAAGLARWWTDGTSETNVGPSLLKNKFLSGNNYQEGFNIWLLYPALGIQYLHPTGVAIYAEIQALFKLPTLANGTYAGLGALLYF